MKPLVHKIKSRLALGASGVGMRLHALINAYNYRNDPFFQQNQEFYAFKHLRDSTLELTRENALRIMESFDKAKREQSRRDSAFSPSNEWLPIYKFFLKEFVGALGSSTPDELIMILNNFWRHPCSTGLVGCPFSMDSLWQKQRNGRQLKWSYKYAYFISDSIFRFRLYEALTKTYLSNDVLDRLHSQPFGNPYGININDRFLRSGSEYHLYYADYLANLLSAPLQHSSPRVVGELGGGFGGMAYYFIRDNMDTCYVNYDLPEILAICQAYLMVAFPSVPIKLYGETNDSSDFSDCRVALMPSFCLEDLPPGSVDAFFNSYSLSEMDSHAINTYLSHISRVLCAGSQFLSVNHSRNAMVGSLDYPYEEHGFELRSLSPALWNQMRFGGGDEVEALAIKI